MLKNTGTLFTLFGAGYVLGSLDSSAVQTGGVLATLLEARRWVETAFENASDFFNGSFHIASGLEKYPLLISAAALAIGFQILQRHRAKTAGSGIGFSKALNSESDALAVVAQIPAISHKGVAERNSEYVEHSMAQPIPRVLLNNPYDKKIEYLTFEERVQIAIQASVRKSRVIGVIYFHLDFEQTGNAPGKALQNDDLMAYLTATLEAQLRSSDCVRSISANEIAVFVSLLADTVQLRSITQRLQTALTKALVDRSYQGTQISEGNTLYPMGGYSSTDLIASARHRATSNRLASGPTAGNLQAPQAAVAKSSMTTLGLPMKGNDGAARSGAAQSGAPAINAP